MFCSITANAQDTKPQYNDDSALTIKETDAYLTGKFQGMEKAASLNQFPTPGKVLKLKDKLNLDQAQINRSIMLRKIMLKYTIKDGRQVVLKERQLYALFKQKKVDLDEVNQLLDEIAQLKAKIRFTQLKTLVMLKGFLSKEQLDAYNSNSNVKTQTMFAFDE